MALLFQHFNSNKGQPTERRLSVADVSGYAVVDVVCYAVVDVVCYAVADVVCYAVADVADVADVAGYTVADVVDEPPHVIASQVGHNDRPLMLIIHITASCHS